MDSHPFQGNVRGIVGCRAISRVAVLKPNGSSGVNQFYVYTDDLNAPRRISRPNDNAIVWRWDSDPFGTTAANEDPDGDSNLFVYNLRFPGQYADAETGLHYNYFRDYDRSTGRCVQSDPIGLDGGVKTYAYALGNPISNYDPAGLAAQGLGAAAAIAVCLRIPACRKAVQEAIKACKDVRCKATRHTAHHKFPGLGYCEHMQIVCFVKGGGQLFRAQFPLPGRCSKEKSPGDWLPDGGRDIPFDEMPFGE